MKIRLTIWNFDGFRVVASIGKTAIFLVSSFFDGFCEKDILTLFDQKIVLHECNFE